MNSSHAVFEQAVWFQCSALGPVPLGQFKIVEVRCFPCPCGTIGQGTAKLHFGRVDDMWLKHCIHVQPCRTAASI